MTTLGDRWRAAVKRPTAAAVTPSDVRARENAAYEKGRRDEKRLHPSHPIITLALILVGAVGAASLYYALREGSFEGGGAVLDRKVSTAETKTIPAIAHAADAAAPRVEQAARSAGAALNSDGARVAQKAKALTAPAR